MNVVESLGRRPEEIADLAGIPITIFDSLDKLYGGIARHMADVVKRKNTGGAHTAMIIPVGPTQQYPAFAQLVNNERIDCSRLYTFNMDEYLDWQGRVIPESHPLSFRKTMRELLFERIDPELRMPESHMFFPDPRVPEEYDGKLRELGGADVCYAGVGYHGHVAFNEPFISRWYKVPVEEFLGAGTHIVALADDTFVINSVREAGGNCEAFPPFAVTVGMRDIMEAKEIVGVFYCGSWQRTVFRRTLMQEPTIEYPGTFLKQNPNFSVYIDADTAAPVEMKPY